jgi:glucose-6-phosphate 1-dehydrogenase
VRLANRVLEPLWNSTHIEQVDILWDETLAMEGRVSYYDKTGALKDVIQNHLLQILCLIAMEPPLTLGEQDLRNRKLDVLRSVRPLTPSDVAARTRRARYTAGRLAHTGGADGRTALPIWMRRELIPGAVPRRSLRSCWSWTAGAGAVRVSCCAPARR